MGEQMTKIKSSTKQTKGLPPLIGAIIPPSFLDPTVVVFGNTIRFHRTMLLEIEIVVENQAGLNLIKSLASNLQVN